jgi:hypothetical protein
MIHEMAKTTKRLFGWSAVAVSLSLALSSPAGASAFCDAKVASYRGELSQKVTPVIAEIDKNIEEIRSRGGNPDNIAVKGQDGTFVTLPQLRDRILSQQAAASKEIDDAADRCANDLKPLQDVTDAGVTITTGGLNKLLPERMTHIEIGEIIAGKPLGGDGALVPNLREQIFAGLGLAKDNGFVTTFVRDPIHAIFPHW